MDNDFIGKKIRMVGLTSKGKNRIRENGDVWHVFAETDRVLFSPGIVGPWLFVSPEGKDHDDRATRWVHASSDVDFKIQSC